MDSLETSKNMRVVYVQAFGGEIEIRVVETNRDVTEETLHDEFPSRIRVSMCLDL